MFREFVREGELRRWAPWVGAVLLILLAVALETGLESVCWDEEAAKAAKIGEAAGCFEFWLNRYQTIIAAVVAFLTALIALAPVRGQLAEMRQQSQRTTYDATKQRVEQISGSYNSILDYRIVSDDCRRMYEKFRKILQEEGVVKESIIDDISELSETLPDKLRDIQAQLNYAWGDPELNSIKRDMSGIAFLINSCVFTIRKIRDKRDAALRAGQDFDDTKTVKSMQLLNELSRRFLVHEADYKHRYEIEMHRFEKQMIDIEQDVFR